MSTFYFGQSPNDSMYYFRLKDNNNETILASTEGYQTRQGCLNGIDAVRWNASNDPNYKRITGRDGTYYFTLQAVNGEPVGRSEGYNSMVGRENGIANCKKEAPSAPVKELTPFTS